MFKWLYKYKAHHLLFWFCYHYMWWTIAIGSPTEAAHNIFFSEYSTKFIFYVIFQAIGVYFNLYYLVPKFLEKRRYIPYLLLVAMTILVTAIFIATGYYLTAYLSPLSFNELFGDQTFIMLFKSNSLHSTVASMTLAMSIKLAKNWIRAQNRQQLLEKEKLETELKFLKSQFNPHFLFNTINSIFVLIHKNPDMASQSLANFSDLLRYQLYECNEGKIPLEKELSYLHNFIELGKLRLDTNVAINVAIDIKTITNHTIAPFVLMPFVENAFKHVSQGNEQKNWVDIQLRLTDNNLLLEVANSKSENSHATDDLIQSSGIGLKNVQRRLDLVYPEQYVLEINKTARTYTVKLQLTLDTATVEEITNTKIPQQV